MQFPLSHCMAAATVNSQVSPSMERTGQWVSSQEIPADLVIRVGESVFPLHKAVMVPKCGYIRKAVTACANSTGTVEVDLSALPGGADAFEKAARYCYGANFEISVRNAAALLCAAAHLDMQTNSGLARRVEEFFSQAALRTLPGAVAVLRSCESLLPAAEELGIVKRSADAIALKICNEILFPTRMPPEWWVAELAALSPASFQKIVMALRCRRADPEVLARAATSYAELALAEVLTGGHADSRQHRELLESVVAVLPAAHDAPLEAAFLCRLLRVAITMGTSTKTCRDLELRVSAVLDQATTDDLLAVVLDDAGEGVKSIDSVRRIIAIFVERETSVTDRRRSLHDAGLFSVALQKVAKTVDGLAAEIATDEELPISKFVGVAGAVPKDARRVHDDLYRAVDIYLKAHPGLDEIEREKVCSVMDPLKLSYQARLHASQNKRLPLQAVLSALYYDQLKLRSSDSAGSAALDVSSVASSTRAQAKADSSLVRENEALRSELARMRAYVSGLQQSKGSGSKQALTASKKGKFLSSVSRTLSRLNPFRSGSKDTSSIADKNGAMHVVKPKRRRFSIS